MPSYPIYFQEIYMAVVMNGHVDVCMLMLHTKYYDCHFYNNIQKHLKKTFLPYLLVVVLISDVYQLICRKYGVHYIV